LPFVWLLLPLCECVRGHDFTFFLFVWDFMKHALDESTERRPDTTKEKESMQEKKKGQREKLRRWLCKHARRISQKQERKKKIQPDKQQHISSDCAPPHTYAEVRRHKMENVGVQTSKTNTHTLYIYIYQKKKIKGEEKWKSERGVGVECNPATPEPISTTTTATTTSPHRSGGRERKKEEKKLISIV
jgi:hypothetical protein